MIPDVALLEGRLLLTGTSAGQLVPSFGNGGIVTTNLSSHFFGGSSASAIQSDGKIIEVGASSPDLNGRDVLTVARYNTDGRLDPTFGTAGVVLTPIGSSSGLGFVPSCVTIQLNGMIVVGGTEIDTIHKTIVRYTSNGSLDPTFGNGGEVTSIPGNFTQIEGLAIKSDGRIVICGTGGAVNQNFVMDQFNSDGTRDTSFGTGGTTFFDFGSRLAGGQAIVALPDGSLIEGGGSGPGTVNFALVHFGSNGAVINSVITPVDTDGSVIKSLARQPDGKIVAAGVAEDSGNEPEFALARYNSDLTLDSSFGTGGLVKTVFPTTFEGFGAESVVIQGNGDIVAGGEQFADLSGIVGSEAILARYRTNGSLDTSFGTGGSVFIKFTSPGSAVTGVHILPNGNILASGAAEVTPNNLITVGFALSEFFGTSDGPQVSDVQRFGYHWRPTSVVLTFDKALNSTSAENVPNYTITGPRGRVIPVDSAVYDATSNTVTLHPHGRLNIHYTYHLTVNGLAPNGLTDTSGDLLNSTATGAPGSNYVTSINRAKLVSGKADANALLARSHHAKK